MGLLQQRELTCHFVSGWTRKRMEETLVLMANGRMNMRSFITHKAHYQQAPELYPMLSENKEPFLGILIDWS